MKIAVFETEQWERGTFDELRDDHELTFSHEPLTADNAAEYEGVDIISPFIYSDLGKSVLAQLTDLTLIATRSTGFDHIDTDYCRENGVTVCNVPTYGDNTVAEHVFGLLLTISHNLVSAIDRTRRGDFSLQGLRGFDLRGRILGVIGTGNIGRCVIEIAKGFHMEAVAYDVARDEELAGRLGFRYVEMEELLSTSDVITVHVPANAKTHHLLSGEEFGKMKQGVVLINTSRGTVVDTQSLLRALAEGRVAAAGLDVLPEEPAIREEAELLRSIFRKKHDLETLLADHILLRLRNVFITPHSAFNTREAIERILATTVENIGSFAEGKPRNVVVGESSG
jgi:D-lactate dehydrogenase